MFKTIKYGCGSLKREFDLTPYNSLQEKEILLAVSINEEEFKTVGVEKIFEYLKSNIKNKEEYHLSKDEKIYLLYALRAISVGETINTRNAYKFFMLQ